MEWTRKIQKLGRIQLPSQYLTANGFTEGDIVVVTEDQKKKLLLVKLTKKSVKGVKNEKRKV